MYGKTKQTCVPSDAQAKEKLALYVYEYLLHVGAQKAAQMFLNEIRWEKNITLGEPPGFLHSWWCVFWDLYCAAPERRDSCQHSNEAKAFYDYGAANMMQSNMPIGAAFPPNGPGGGPPPIDPMRMRMSHHMPPHGHPHHMGPVPPQLRHPGVGGVGGCPPMVRPFSPPVVQHQQQQHPQGMHPQGGVPPPPHDNIHPQGGNMPPQQSNNIQMNEGVPTMMTSSNNDQSWGCSPNMPPQQHAAMLSRGGDMSQGGGPPTSNQNNQNFTGLQGPSQLNHPDQIPCSVATAGGHGGQPMIGGGGGNNGGGPSQQSMGFSSGQSQQTPPMSSAHFVENSSNVNNMNQHIGDPQFKQRRMSDEPSNSAFSGNSSIGSPIVHGPLAPMYNMMNKVGLPGPSLAKQQGSGPCGVTNVSEQMLNVGMSDVKIEKNCGPVDVDQEKGSICSSPSSRNISTPNNSSSCNNNRSNTNNSNVGGVGIKKEELTTPTTSHQSDLIHESMIKNESQAYNKQGADDEEPNHAETTGGNVGGCSINTGIDSDMVQPSFTHQSPSTIKQESGCVDLGGIGGAGLPISGQSSESQF